MSKFSKKMQRRYRETKRSSLAVYLTLRILVLICMIIQILHGSLTNAVLCGLVLILFTVPTIIEERYKIELPNTLEIIIYCFIFAAEILGEINNFYHVIPFWDTMLHTMNGFLCAGVGFSLVSLLNDKSKNIDLSPFYVALVAFCFSMTVGVVWEFFEYSMDKFFQTDMQKDFLVNSISSVKLNKKGENQPVAIDGIQSTTVHTEHGDYTIDGGYLDIGINDTMKDLLVNFIGAVVFCSIGYIYLKHNEKQGFASNFIPKVLRS